MKSALGLTFGLLFILSIAISCKKSIEKSNSLIGDWVLLYSTTASSHLEYPGDMGYNIPPNGGSFSTWASHVSIITKDSAYWVNCGVDLTPQQQHSGSYSVSTDPAYVTKITFNFPIGTWSESIYSTFEYSLIGSDTLKLKEINAAPTTYTYFRK